MKMLHFLSVLFVTLFVTTALSSAQVSVENANRRLNTIDSPPANHAPNQAQIPTAVAIAQRFEYNPEVCFAVDGSEAMGSPGFLVQKEFVKLLAVAIESVEPKVQHAGVQYGKIPVSISEVRDDVQQFVDEVDSTAYLNTSNTFIAPGIVKCWTHLQMDAGKPQKLVLFLHSSSNYVDMSSAIAAAKGFLANPANSLFVVGLGSGFKKAVLNSLAGSPYRVFVAQTWAGLVAILPVLVERICAALVEAVPVGRT